jgi:hypothetical protein
MSEQTRDSWRLVRALRSSGEFRGRQLVNQVRMRLAGTPRAGAAIERLKREGGVGTAGASPVFVLGSGWRTGSTLVQRMLNQTGDVLIWGEPYTEGALLQRLTEALTFLDPVAGRFHGKVLPDDGELPSPGVWTANMTPPLSHLVAAQKAMLDRLWAVPAEQHGCTRWGVKEVVWGRAVIDLLAVLYPDARFLLLVRDPLTQWRSYRPVTRRPWYYRWPDQPVGSPRAFGMMWRNLVEDFVAASNDLPRATLVRYEDLREEAELARLTEFLGLAQPLSADAARVGSSQDRRFYTDAVPSWEKAVIGRLTSATARRAGYG